jgi:hypothetical protein
MLNTSPQAQGASVIGENKQRWKQLCEQAANEQDPAKPVELVKKRRLDSPPDKRKNTK